MSLLENSSIGNSTSSMILPAEGCGSSDLSQGNLDGTNCNNLEASQSFADFVTEQISDSDGSIIALSYILP